MSRWFNIVDAHLEAVRESRGSLSDSVERFVSVSCAALGSNKKLLVCGNGGSAADAQHFVAELVGRFYSDRRALPAIALTTDTSTITAIGNDIGFEHIFSRQLEALAESGDVLVAISTSGNSPNVVEAARRAGQLGMTVVGMTGQAGGRLLDHAGVAIRVPSDDVPRIQEVHELVLHCVALAVEDWALNEVER